MTTRFVVPPTWPAPPAGWVPSEGWQPSAEWGPPPVGWQFWQDDAPQVVAPQAYPEATASALPAPISRRSWGRRLGWLMVLVGGLVSYLLVNQTMLDTQNVLFFPTVLLVGSVTVPAAVLLLEYAIGQGLDGHGGLIMGTAVMAGIVGVTLAGWLENSLTGPQSQVLLGVAVIEELAKLLVPLVIFLVARRRTAGAGLAVGIAAGAGFAVLETMGYAFYALVSRGGGLAAMQQTLQLRALLAPASHVAWTGMVAWALWRIGATPRRRFAVTGLVVTFAGAVGLHYLWDQTNDLTPHVVIAVISVAILVTLMVLTPRRDKVRTLSHGPATGPAAIAPVPQLSWFSPVAILPVQPVATRPVVSVPERHAA
ncbi:MAG TPA: PrsW family glutamic-type intramembrane protease [Propionibacteriaceae bacterium]